LPRTVSTNEAPTGEANHGIHIHVLDGPLERSGLKESVRIQEHHVTSSGPWKAAIIGARETKISIASNYAGPVKFGLNHFRRAVTRIIVDDNSLV
jgi:hypothetical protein